MHLPPLNRVAFVGNYVPRRCGLATFTRDLRSAVAAHLPLAECPVIAMDDGDGPADYPPEVWFACSDADPDSHRRAAELLTLANVDVVSLQHEYGIFGGPAGERVLDLLRELRMPVHTTLHTVLARPEPAQRRVMDEILHLSARVAVMTDHGRDLLRTVHGVADDRIDVIPHGIPDTPFVDPEFRRRRLGFAGTHVLLTFGLLSPGKGIEHVIRAMPEIVARQPEAVYVVAGATHPRLVRDEGERYRESLIALAAELGVSDRVVFRDRYLEMNELLGFIGAADVYVTPYLGEEQITSGTLAYAFGCGTAVVSTPYRHAAELLADGRGTLVPFRDPAAIALAVCDLLADDVRRQAPRTQGWLLGRGMIWQRVAARHAESLARTRLAALVRRRRSDAPVPPVTRRRLPEPVLEHLWRLIDSTGVMQHAVGDLPLRSEGYCTDDNARALTAMVRLDDVGLASPWSERAACTCASFLAHAFDSRSGRFRNFMDYSRRWLDEAGSDDCLGRGIVALGTCLGRSRRESLRRFAMERFAPAVGAVLASTSPRGWALAIIGLREYQRRLRGDRAVAAAGRELTSRLLALHRNNAGPDWPWPEDVVAYENARLGEALIAGGDAFLPEAREVGLRQLDWLWSMQVSESGRFSPVGCRGFLRRGGLAATFDQQPIEAQAMVAACVEAYRATGDGVWRDRGWLAFEWFHGHNVLGAAVADPRTGGCGDGLLEDRVSENQGAESTLAYLAAVIDVRLLAAELPRERRAARRPGCDPMEVTRTGVLLRPNNARVLYRPFEPPQPQRAMRIIGRVMSLAETEVERLLAGVLSEFHGRHQRLVSFFGERFESVRRHLLTDQRLSNARQLLIGSYFTQEYALESAALFNPSIVLHPDQTRLASGTARFILSLRATGEGHVSSVGFRSGTVDAHGVISLAPPTGYVTAPRSVASACYDKPLFLRKLAELGIVDGLTDPLFLGLDDQFTLHDLEKALSVTSRQQRVRRREWEPLAAAIVALAQANYEIECDPASDISERVIFPYSPAETNGIEDARFVRFTDDDGSTRYCATYTAFDGSVTLPQFLETDDFVRFRVSTLNGPEIANKGMALFPRRIRGAYVMLSRQDGENIFLMETDMLHFWHTRRLILRPTQPWEYVQIGNCGSPIETPAGWLVLTHGVGAMRKYSIGAVLLDLDDPSRVIGRLAEPLLSANENERVGYVPNVVYSCGGMVHEGLLVIPYSMSDYATSFATVPLADVLAALTP